MYELTNDGFYLHYQYVNGKSEYFIDRHESKNRILPFCVAVSVKEGKYFVDFDGGLTVTVSPGETIFIQSFVRHTVRMEHRGKLTHAHFICSYATIDIFALTNLNYFISDDERIQDILNALNRKVYDNEIVQNFYTDKLLCELYLTLSDLNIIERPKLVIEPWLYASLKYIRENLCRGITVDGVILASGRSKTVFYKIFKDKMKVSPREYIESERFKVASMLLLKGKKVKEVAKAIGFTDVSYFNKVFKSKYGMTPIEHKQKMNYNKGELL